VQESIIKQALFELTNYVLYINDAAKVKKLLSKAVDRKVNAVTDIKNEDEWMKVYNLVKSVNARIVERDTQQ